jgi:hypothetical protein
MVGTARPQHLAPAAIIPTYGRGKARRIIA